MARPAVYRWPAANTQAISLTQTLGGAGNLLLNGTLALNGQVTFGNIVRTASLTSANNLSGVNFTITGINFNGQIFSEVVAGPNNNTVYSVEEYSSILSIASNGAAAAVSAGSGQTGHTQWYQFDYHSAGLPSISFQYVIANTLTSSIVMTLDDVTTNLTPLVVTLANGNNASGMSFSNFLTVRYVCFTVDNGTTNGSAVFTLLQQGIN